jgi:hypothetical protein
MDAHAILAPSSAPVWGYCAGSVRAALSYPDFTTPEAEIGTAAHWVGSEVLERYKAADGGCPSAYDWIGKKAPNGITIDEEMAEGAEVYVSDVIAVAQEYGGLQLIEVEQRLYMPDIHPDNWGTLDGFMWVKARGHLFLWEYKHGHRHVSAVGNLQLIDYTKGIMNRLEIDGREEQHITVHHRVVQPFAYKGGGAVEEWIVNAAGLRGAYNQLSAQAYEAMGNAPTLTPGKHCRDCPAVAECQGATLASYALADFARTEYAMDKHTPAQLGTEFGILQDAITLLKARSQAVEEQIKATTNGTGYTLESAKGHLKWTADPAVVIMLCKSIGIEVAKPGLITPTQALSYAKGESLKAIIKSISTRPLKGVKLTKAADSKVAKAFKRT